MRQRLLCRICLVVIGMIILFYQLDRERFFPMLCTSICEQKFEDGEKITASGQIYKKVRKQKTVALYLKNVRIQELPNRAATDERLLIYLKQSKNSEYRIPSIGREVLVTGTVSFFRESPNPGNFNQKFYYQKQKIHAAVREAKVLKTAGEAAAVREALWQFRSRMADMLIDIMGEKQGGILTAMLLGETAYTDVELKEVYQKSGIGHLLAISGLHVSFLGLGIYRILRKTGTPIWISASAGSAVLGMYVVMAGGSISAVRALIMFLVRMGAEWCGREYDGLTALSVAALVVLVPNPLRLFDAGFLLSFGAVFGIYGIKTLRAPVAMQVVMLPVILYYYYEMNIYSFIWNLVVLPLASVILGMGIAGVTIRILPGIVGNVMSRLSLACAGAVLCFYEAGSRLLLELPGARWVTGRPKWWQIGGYYLLMGVCLFLLDPGKKDCRRDGLRKGLRAVTAACAMTVLLAGRFLAERLPGDVSSVSITRRGQMEIVMLDVDQGDCFFIRGPGGETYLIDGGSSTQDQVGKYRIEPFLKSQGVGSLDYVWVSHGDSDHMNGILELLGRQDVGVKIRHLVLPERAYWNDALFELAQTAEGEGIPILVLEQGKQFENQGMTLTCLWPEHGKAADGKAEESENESSMVLSLSYGSFDMLFTGDLEKESEDQVAELLEAGRAEGSLPLSYEVLKLGHHGSKNSTGEGLLAAVRPEYAFCSAGRENRYGHPHEETLERLAKWGVSLYNTKDRSAVQLCTDGKKYCILRP